MPLDGSEMFSNSALAKLWEVECLLATEDQWCKGRLHDRKGRHCLVGALAEANARHELTRPIVRAIKDVSGKHYWRIESFNDDPATNHQDVLRVLHRARLIILAELAREETPRAWYVRLFDKLADEILGLPRVAAGHGRDSDWAAQPMAVTTRGIGEPVAAVRGTQHAARETCDLLQ